MSDVAKCVEDSLRSQSELDLAVEAYIDGHEVDIDILVQNNKVYFVGISDNFKPDEPNFFELGATTPSIELSNDEKKWIAENAAEWITKMNIDNSVVHFEARCRPKSLYGKSFDQMPISEFLVPIEVNNRLGGFDCWTMYTIGYGVNLFLEAIDIALGFDLDEAFLRQQQIKPNFQCISNIYHPAKNALIEKIEVDLSAFQNDPKTVDLSLFKPVGDRLTIQEYLGWLTVRDKYGSSIEEMRANLDLAMSYVHVDLKENELQG